MFYTPKIEERNSIHLFRFIFLSVLLYSISYVYEHFFFQGIRNTHLLRAYSKGENVPLLVFSLDIFENGCLSVSFVSLVNVTIFCK